MFIVRLMTGEVVGQPCPDPATVAAAIADLVPTELASLASSVTITDRGETFEVKVGDTQRTFADANRNCAERVRVAAVFAAMNLAPPPQAADEPEPEPIPQPVPEAKPPAQPAPVPSPPPHVWSVDVLAQSRRGFAAGTAGPFWLWGGGVRAAWGTQRWQGAIAAGAFLGSADTAASSSVRVRRWHLSAGLRNTIRFAAFDVESEMALRGNLMQVQARGVLTPGSGSRLEGSLHTSVGLRWRGARHLCPIVGMEVEGVPRPTELRLLPIGRVGQSPALWIGLFVGLGWQGP